MSGIAQELENLSTSVRSTILTGLVLSNTAITAADSILTAFGKAQGQINARAVIAPVTRNSFAFRSGWYDAIASSYYFKTPFNIVSLVLCAALAGSGNIQGYATIITMPSGYLPPALIRLPVEFLNGDLSSGSGFANLRADGILELPQYVPANSSKIVVASSYAVN